MKSNQYKLHIYLIALFIFNNLNEYNILSQNRLHTLSSLELAKNDVQRDFINNILDYPSCIYPAFIDCTHQKSFYIDSARNVIEYTRCIPARDMVLTSTPERVTIPINKTLSYFLYELFQLAVVTSSPQNGCPGLDMNTYYLIMGPDVGEFWECEGYNDLSKVCQYICDECQCGRLENEGSLISWITDLTVGYKKKLNLDYWQRGEKCGIGTMGSYLYFFVDFDTKKGIPSKDIKKTLVDFAQFVIDNSDGPINCNIVVVEPDDSRLSYTRKEDIEEIIVSSKDFSTRNLINLYKKSLVSKEN